MKVIAFDMDGVLLKDLEDHFWRGIVPRIAADRWRMDVEDARRRILRLLDVLPKDGSWYSVPAWEWFLGIRGLVRAYLDEVGPKKTPQISRGTLKRLREKFKIGVETNADPEMARAMLRMHGLDGLMDFVFTPADAGCSKKKVRYYERLAEFLKVPPEEITVVAHDPEERIAEKVGMRVIVVGPEDLSGDRLMQLIEGR